MDIDINKPHRENLELCCNFYLCPNCYYESVFSYDHYCANCGYKLNWDKNSVKQTIRID